MATNNAWNSQFPAQVAAGGTGDASFTAYAPVCGGTTSTGALQQATTGISTSGFVLTSTGSGSLPTFQSTAGITGALVKIQSQTASAQASLSFTTGITAAYNNFIIEYTSCTNPSGGAGVFLLMQLSTNGGSSYIITNYSNNGYAGTNGMGLAGFPNGTQINSGTINLYNATAGSGLTSCLTGQIAYTSSAVTSGGFSNASIQKTGSLVVNALNFVSSDSNNWSGTITVYGIIV